MRQVSLGITVSAALVLLLAGAAGAAARRQTTHDVPGGRGGVGDGCMDKYEASVWRVPDPTTANKALVAKIREGTATAADLTAGGATQLGMASDDYAPCANSGQNCAERHLRGEPAGRDAVGVHHVVPGAAGVQERAQAAAVECGVAGGGGGDAGPGAGQRHDGLQHEQHASRWPSPGRAAAACRRAAPSTWWATCPSGWRTGCRGRRCAEPGAPASARRATFSAWRARPPPVNPAR